MRTSERLFKFQVKTTEKGKCEKGKCADAAPVTAVRDLPEEEEEQEKR